MDLQTMQSNNARECNFQALFDNVRAKLEGTTKQVIDRELGLFELNLVISSIEGNKLDKAHEDTEELKKEMWELAKQASKKSGKSQLEEYKQSLNFI
jgi:hypothetical protein